MLFFYDLCQFDRNSKEFHIYLRRVLKVKRQRHVQSFLLIRPGNIRIEIGRSVDGEGGGRE